MNSESDSLKLEEHELSEVDFFGQLARRRLEEDPYTAESITALLSGELPEKLPICIGGEFWGRWVGSTVAEFYGDPVTRFKAICAGIVRFRANTIGFMSYALEIGPLFKHFGAQPADLGGGFSPLLFSGHPIKDSSDVENLKIPTESEIKKIFKHHLWYTSTEKRLLGNILGPRIYFLLDPLAFAGAALRGIQNIHLDMKNNPSLVHELCEFATKVLTKLGQFEKSRGVHAICIFGGSSFLSPAQCEEFLIPYMETLLKALRPCKLLVGGGGDTTHTLGQLCQLPCDGLFLDSETPVPEIIKTINEFEKFCFRTGVSRKLMITGSYEEIEKHVGEVADAAKKIASPILSDILDYRVSFENVDIAVTKAIKTNYPRN